MSDVLERRRPRHVPALAEWQCRRRHSLPGILARLQGSGAFPRPLRRGLTAGMGDLDTPFGGAGATAMLDDALKRRLVVVAVEPDTAVGNATGTLHMGGLDDDQSGTAIGQHPE